MGRLGGITTANELRRASPNIDDQIRRITDGRTETPHGPGERQSRLFDTGHHLGLDTQPCHDTGDELVAIGGVARGRGCHETHALDLQFIHHLRVFVAGGEGTSESFRRQSASAIDVVSETNDCHAPISINKRPSAAINIGDE